MTSIFLDVSNESNYRALPSRHVKWETIASHSSMSGMYLGNVSIIISYKVCGDVINDKLVDTRYLYGPLYYSSICLSKESQQLN